MSLELAIDVIVGKRMSVGSFNPLIIFLKIEIIESETMFYMSLPP